ncbi:peroxisome membrane protein [Phlyctochytrium arcticum]|nr:peroxisome membrane protein [Phlyctochytrium arcticum]
MTETAKNFVKKYEQFVLHNAPQIGGIESGLRSLTYILPGRFTDADMASEAIFAGVNLMSLFHDTILAQAALRQQPETPTGKFNRYTRYMLRSNSPNGNVYKRVAYSLAVVQMLEVLAEMAAAKLGGKKGKSRAVLGIEIIKVLCRGALLRLNSNRMILHSPVPERDYDPSTVLPPPSTPPAATWKGTRTGKEHLHVDLITNKEKGGYDHAMQYLLSKALTEGAATPVDLLGRLGGARKVSEWMFILRPLIYVLALRRYGRRSYKPYTISLAMELISLLLAMSSSSHSTINSLLGRGNNASAESTGSQGLTQLERDEYKRRHWLLLYYLLRDPFYSLWTKAKMDSTIESASKKPLISLFSGILRDYQPLWEKWHFYTSGY